MAYCLLSIEAMEEWKVVEKTLTSKLIVDLSIDIEDPDLQVAAKKKADREAQRKAVGYTDETFKECVQYFLGKRVLARTIYKQKS